MLTLITGGARSGKSRFAQSLCARGARAVYIATARPGDPEMRARIARHRADRPAHWVTVEEPLALAGAVAQNAAAEFVLIDCLTVWLNNFCFQLRDRAPADIECAVSQEIAGIAAASSASRVIAVTNEVGSGIVPESSVGRLFRDLHGLANQQLARAADRVYLTVAGIPIRIKPQEGGL